MVQRLIRAGLAMAALLLVAALLPASARTPELSEAWNGAEINWRDIKSGIYESAKTGRPVIMVFHAAWCPSCKKYRAVFYDREIVEAAKEFVMILVDGDKDKAVNGAFAPDGTYVPRTLFLDSDGNIQEHLIGKGDPKYPHSIDISGPAELLSLMKRARETMKGFDLAPSDALPEGGAGEKT